VSTSSILLSLSEKARLHPIFTIVIVVITAIICLSFSSSLQMVTSSETFFPEDSVVYNEFKAYQKDFGTDTVFVMVKSDDVTHPFVLDYISLLEKQLRGLDYVISTSSPVSNTQNSALIPGRDTALIIVPVPELENPKVIAIDMERAIDFVDRPPDVTVEASGGPMLDYQLGRTMGMSMGIMFFAAIIIMVLILYTFFRTIVGGRLLPFLPLLAVTLSLIISFGLMAVLEIPISMILTGFLSVLIGLGIDYGIQVMSRYEEERSKGCSVNEAIAISVTKMGSAVGLAVITTIIGFGSMLFADIPDLENFGMAVCIGLVISFIMAVWFIPAVLKLVDKGPVKIKIHTVGLLDKFLLGLSRISIKHPVLILVIVTSVAITGAVVSPKVDTLTDFYQYFPPDLEAIEFMEEMHDLTGGTDTITLIIHSDMITSPGTLNKMLMLCDYIQSHETSVISTNNFINYPYDTTGVIDLSVEHMEGDRLDDAINNIRSSIDYYAPELDITITGEPLLNNFIGHSMTDGQKRMTLISFVFVYLAMILIFKSFIRALLPMAPIIVVILISSGLMWYLDIPQTTLSISTNSIILGLGVDYSIHIMHRYREERENGASSVEAIRTTIPRIGKSIVTSGLTTAGGFAAMMLSPFPLMVWFGIIAFLSILMILLLTLTMLPAMLILLDTPHILSRNNTPKGLHTLPYLNGNVNNYE